MANARSVGHQICWCGFYASGVILTLLVYGLLQERIMQRPYDGGNFAQSVFFLVLLIRSAAFVFALFMARATGEDLGNGAEMHKYLYVALSNVFASACSYEALKYVSFGVAALGKSFKMMPVMIWTLAISGRRYGLTDWVVATVVTGGVTEFLLTGPTASATASGSSAWGLLLLVGFLVLDGFTLTMQEKLFCENRTTTYNQMMYVNGMSSLVALGTIAMSGDLGPALRFALAHGEFVWDAALLSAAAVGAQYFKYSLVKEAGALAFAATMNIRQVLSILLSYVAYHHVITVSQAAALSAVFGALFYRTAVSLAATRDAERTLMQGRDSPEGPLPEDLAGQYGAAGTSKS